MQDAFRGDTAAAEVAFQRVQALAGEHFAARPG